MRYIRKHIARAESARAAQDAMNENNGDKDEP
jgi:hypothetical protein